MSGMRVAIIGAGPAGCFTAQFIKRVLADAEVSLIDRLPVPYGLVRYGVAPDHVGTKQVVNQFERQIASGLVHFFGHVEIGKDISIDELASHFDVLVWASGLQMDRRLGVPGESLHGVWGAGEVTRFFNDHPEECNLTPHFGSEVAVIGNGNVAIDIIRLLAKRDCDLEGTEVSDTIQKVLEDSEIQTIHLIGRSPASDGKFDVVMIRELKKLEHIKFKLADPGLLEELQEQAESCPKSKVLAELITESKADAEAPQIIFHFNWAPQEIVGSEIVEQITLLPTHDTALESRQLKVSTVITAIGFQEGKEAKELEVELSSVSIPVLKVGWCKRGPSGKIADNRNDAKEVADQIADLAKQRQPSGRAGSEGLRALLEQKGVQYANFEGWKKIDAKERQQAPTNRVRKKIACIQEMLATAKQ